MEQSNPIYKVLLKAANEVVYTNELNDVDLAADASVAKKLLSEEQYVEIRKIVVDRLAKINRLIDKYIEEDESGMSRENLYFSDGPDRDDIERRIFE